MLESALKTRAAGPTNERRALRQLYILFSVCWTAIVVFGIHFHWSHHQARWTTKFMWTAGFVLVPPALAYLLFYVIFQVVKRIDSALMRYTISARYK